MTTEEYIEANPRARLFVLVALLLGLVVFAFLLPALERWVAFGPEATLEEVERITTRVEVLAWVVGVIQVLLFGFFSYWGMKTGRAVLATGQIPPPGAWMAVRTRIRRGRVAIYMGWTYRVLAVLIWVPGALWLAFMYYLFDAPK